MDPPPPPFAAASSTTTSSSSSPSPPSPSSSSASITMVIITVVGIFAAFALLASYYAFVTKCQLLRAVWSRHPPWHRRARGAAAAGGGWEEASSVGGRVSTATTDDGRRGLGLPLIRMLPVVKFTAAASDGGAALPRISVSECAVCLSEFVERERVRLLPNCSHAFHIDCIDTWLQGSARCPFCRSDVTLPPLIPSAASAAGFPRRRDDALAAGDSIVIEVRGEHERWFSSHGTTTTTTTTAGGGGRGPRRLPTKQRSKAAESVGDEAIDTRKKTTDEEFAVQPLRRSLSLDSSSCGKQLYVSIQELLAAQRQVRDPSVHS